VGVSKWPLADIRQPEKPFSPYRPFRFLSFHRCHRQQPTPLRHSDMDLSFPIPVIGKVALSIHTGRSRLYLKQENSQPLLECIRGDQAIPPFLASIHHYKHILTVMGCQGLFLKSSP
jgi:hypothetical protein